MRNLCSPNDNSTANAKHLNNSPIMCDFFRRLLCEPDLSLNQCVHIVITLAELTQRFQKAYVFNETSCIKCKFYNLLLQSKQIMTFETRENKNELEFPIDLIENKWKKNEWMPLMSMLFGWLWMGNEMHSIAF